MKDLKDRPKGPWGGRRAGAGIRRGTKTRHTLEKTEAREVARQIITRELEPLIQAQIANAKGLKYLVTRDKATGKFIRVTEGMKLGTQDEIIEVWAKDPSVQAFTDLMNRALDKPAEQIRMSQDVSGDIRIIVETPWKTASSLDTVAAPRRALPASGSQAPKARHKDNGNGHG